jgi:hypothetical protein
MAAALTALAACNMITGADGVTFDDDDDGSGNSTASGWTTAASGGATTTTAGPGVGGGNATVGTGQQVASSGSGAAEPCVYPAGPYGVAEGQVVPPTLSWQGYAPGSATATTVSVQDFFDCDGSKGINAVMVDTSQFG